MLLYFFPKSVWPQVLAWFIGYMHFRAERPNDTLLSCTWSYTCESKSSLGFWAVVAENLHCYVDMSLAEKSLDWLGNLFKKLCFFGYSLDLSILTICHVVSHHTTWHTKDELENSVIIATSKTVIISLVLSPSCCFTLLTYTAFPICFVVLVSTCSSWQQVCWTPPCSASFNF